MTALRAGQDALRERAAAVEAGLSATSERLARIEGAVSGALGRPFPERMAAASGDGAGD